MKRVALIISLLVFSFSTFASADDVDNKKLDKMVNTTVILHGYKNLKRNDAPVLSLLSEPYKKQKLCAKKGYIGYQNALAATYLTGSNGAKANSIKAYGWTLVAYHQISKTGNKKLIAAEQKTLNFVAEKMAMTNQQKKKANEFAYKIIKNYSNAWPAPSTILKMKNFPMPCDINVTPVVNSNKK